MPLEASRDDADSDKYIYRYVDIKGKLIHSKLECFRVNGITAMSKSKAMIRGLVDASGTIPLHVTFEHTLHFKIACSVTRSIA